MKNFKETIVLNSIPGNLINVEENSISIKDSSVDINSENTLEIGLGKNEVMIFAEVENFKSLEKMVLNKKGFFKGPDYSKLKLSEEKKSIIIFMDKKSCLSLIYKIQDKKVEKALEFENASEKFEELDNISDKTEDLISLILGRTEEELKQLLNNKEYIITTSVV